MKVIDKRQPTTGRQRAREIPVNTCFSGIIGIHGSICFLRTQSSIVDLTDAKYAWRSEDIGEVDDYQPVEAELTILRNL